MRWGTSLALLQEFQTPWDGGRFAVPLVSLPHT